MIEVLHPGLFTTVQDLGRDGWAHLGISPAGATDPVALRIGNWLVGNEPNAAALEMTLVGGRYRFERDALVAITGTWSSFVVPAGEVVDVGPIRTGARAYLCIAGGVQVDPVFGSRSTHVLSHLGGFQGRALRKGDRIRFGRGDGVARTLPDRFHPLTVRSRVLRATGMTALPESEYMVREESDRMGLRLSGAPVTGSSGEMVSEGMPLGAVQVPPSGEPILLGVDAQTTGGYPVLGAVITADLPSLGQLRPRDRIRFERVSLQEAWRLAREQAALLNELR